MLPQWLNLSPSFMQTIDLAPRQANYKDYYAKKTAPGCSSNKERKNQDIWYFLKV